MPRRSLALALLLLAPASLLANTAGQWQADVAFVVAQIESRHPNPFLHVSKQQFEAAANSLSQQIPQMTDHQVTISLMKLVAMLEDGHTAIYSPYTPLPIRFRWFSDGLFVNAASSDYSRALGAKVVRIGNIPVDQAYAAMSAIISHENDQWVREITETYLATAELLDGLGIASGSAPVPYVFEDLSGAQFELDVAPSSDALIWPPDSSNGYVPLWRWNYNLNYWFQYLPTTNTIYIGYTRCAQMANLSFGDFMNQVLAVVAQQPVDRIIVDFRSNSGGDSTVFQPFLDALTANPILALKVRAIIGQATFSSGVMNASSLAYQFGVPLIGQPSGGSPTCFGDVVYFTLPNSGYTLGCGTKLFICYPGYVGNSLLPDRNVAVSSADYFARYDPILTAATIWPAVYQPPQPGAGGMNALNTASWGAPVSPGSLVATFGTFPAVTPAQASSMPLPTTLGGVQVKVNGVAAPLLGVWPTQVNFQLPSGTAAGTAQITVTVSNQNVASGAAAVVDSSPGIFLMDPFDVDRPGAVLSQENQATSATVRAARNEAIQIFATGAGPLSTAVQDGAAAPASPLAPTIALPRVFIAEQEASVEFSGLAPDYVGLWQVNARIPDVAGITGQVPVVLVAPEGNASNAATIWVW